MDIGEGRVRVGAAGVVRKNGKILLGRRNKPGATGKWILPGGGVDFNEKLVDALRREMKEETGIDIDVKEQIGAYELIYPPMNLHKIIIYYWANYTGGDIVASDDVSEARFFSSEEAREIIESGQSTETIAKVLRDIKFI